MASGNSEPHSRSVLNSMHNFLHNTYYAVFDGWNEATRLTAWFGVPLLLYVFLPLTALAAVVGRLRMFKGMLALTLLIVVPTALFWNDYGMTLVWFHRHYSNAPPPAPAKRHRIRFAVPDGYVVLLFYKRLSDS